MSKKLSRINKRGTNPLKTIRFWAIVLVPVVVVLVAAGALFIILDKPMQKEVFTRVAIKQADNTYTYTYTYKGEPKKKDNTSVTVPATYKNEPVTEIGANAFKNFLNLTEVILPDTIKIIHDNAFNGCTALESIVIPNSVTELKASAFANCTALTDITLSQNMTKIDGKTFENCTALEKIDLPKKIARVDSKAFDGAGIKTVVVRIEVVLKVVGDSFPFEQLESVYVLGNTLLGEYWQAEIWKDHVFDKGIIKQPLPA